MLRAYQQRIGLHTKIRAGYRGDAGLARPPATLNQQLKIVGLVLFGQLIFFDTNAIDFLFLVKMGLIYPFGTCEYPPMEGGGDLHAWCLACAI